MLKRVQLSSVSQALSVDWWSATFLMNLEQFYRDNNVPAAGMTVSAVYREIAKVYGHTNVPLAACPRTNVLGRCRSAFSLFTLALEPAAPTTDGHFRTGIGRIGAEARDCDQWASSLARITVLYKPSQKMPTVTDGDHDVRSQTTVDAVPTRRTASCRQ